MPWFVSSHKNLTFKQSADQPFDEPFSIYDFVPKGPSVDYYHDNTRAEEYWESHNNNIESHIHKGDSYHYALFARFGQKIGTNVKMIVVYPDREITIHHKFRKYEGYGGCPSGYTKVKYDQ